MRQFAASKTPNGIRVPPWPPIQAARHRATTVCAVLLSCLLAFGPASAKAAKTIAMYTYHTHPPFITGKNQGLTYDLADYLTSKSSERFVFVVMPMSRPHLNKAIEQPEAAIVPWVNPAWFKDKAETRYLWSRYALMEDANGIVSRQDARIVYEGPASLSGHAFGGIRGHVYTGIDPFIAQSNTTRRVDSDNHVENFTKLRDGRIDVTLIPESAARYLIKEHGLEDTLYISPEPHSRYQRRLLVPGGRTDLIVFVDGLFFESSEDNQWQELIARYR